MYKGGEAIWIALCTNIPYGIFGYIPPKGIRLHAWVVMVVGPREPVSYQYGYTTPQSPHAAGSLALVIALAQRARAVRGVVYPY
jgi:hypothetical protein